jgi:Glyoxalase-like domain
MVSRVSHTTIDCSNAFELSEWWKAVLEYTDVPGDPNEAGDEECMILDPASGHRLLFIETGDAKLAKNRVHLDLVPTDRPRDDEVERVVALGARHVADLRRADGTGWVVLGDPEGNEFCVLRSDVERARSEAGPGL